jgi:hypothetical protein
MILLFSALRLRSGENIEWRKGANRYQKSGRPVGGRLVLTSMRLIFQPHRLDAALRGQSWEVKLNHIASVGRAPAQVGPSSVRDTLWIGVSEEDNEYFIVNKLHSTIEDLRRAAGQGTTAPSDAVTAPTFRPRLDRRLPLATFVVTAASLYGAVVGRIFIEYIVAGMGAVYLTAYLVRRVGRKPGSVGR